MHKNFNHRLHRRLRHPRHRPHHLGGRPVQQGEMVRNTKGMFVFIVFLLISKNIMCKQIVDPFECWNMSSKFLER
jgi:hypothetical protein